MATDQTSIPLFPLQIVLFPASRIPLHIFEDRYRRMIRECIDANTEFGINLLENKHLHPVGCTARVEGITRTYADGSFDIVVEGMRRYKLITFTPTETGYLRGTVQTIEDAADPVSEELVLKAVSLYEHLLKVVNPGGDNSLPYDPSGHLAPLSFMIAEKAGLDVSDRQRLLEDSKESDRLTQVVRHLETIIPRLRETVLIRKLAKNDGYLPRARKAD